MKLIRELLENITPITEDDIVVGARFSYLYHDVEFQTQVVKVIDDRALMVMIIGDGENMELSRKPMDLSTIYDGDDEKLMPVDTSYEHMIPKKAIVKVLGKRNARRIL